ncbi:DUF292-domain-containing protein [Tilletiopsis washingtonensis]|uniref:DUF292-domain-containing protein n=1 Tax=Tilletiopsis washingtonensis TaxID=58919 RepID=A0A316Z623_9BASI|nr:DUF292-domain-containing protein [Tilletiopsis washingtonensis]PWN97069.1 DUF292-domain-containing protein [Tilletiopsis washingtonensis]
MPPAPSSTRTKVQLKLVVQRLRMLQEKKSTLAKRDRRDVASLVEKGKLETARIKTEGIVAEDIHVELLEVLELYAEMLIARFALLDLPGREPDASLLEPLCALIHAAPRTELRELHALREMLMAKYTREFALRATENADGCVPSRVTDRLKAQVQQRGFVDSYIAEVCRAYNVPFSSPYLEEATLDAPPSLPSDSLAADAAAAAGNHVNDGGDESTAAQALSDKAPIAAQSDARVAAATGTPKTPGAQVPGGGGGGGGAAATTATAAGPSKEEKAKKNAASASASEVDSLEARFAALKKR